MKLKGTREHFVTKDFGKTWQAKLAFESESEIKNNKEYNDPYKWHPYECGFCGKYHIAKINRNRKLKYDY